MIVELSQTSLARLEPMIAALHARADQVADAELNRLSGRLPDLDEQARLEVARTVYRVVHTMLHTPAARARELAAGPGGDTYAAALRALFDLDRP